MKHILPTFLSAAAILNLLVVIRGLWPGFHADQPRSLAAKPEAAAEAEATARSSSPRRPAASSTKPAIAADLRYKIDAFGHELVGTGRYLQLGAGADKLLRLELKMQVAGKPATLQEICGPDTIWVRRDVPPAAPTLGRVNLQQLRQTLARTWRRSAATISCPPMAGSCSAACRGC